MKFAEKVRAARLNMGYTQKQLAEKTHVALRTIVSYERSLGTSRELVSHIFFVFLIRPQP